MTWKIDDPQGAEAAKVAWDIVPYTRGRVLDLGCGPSKCYPHFIGVDSGADRQLFGIAMKPDFEMPCEKLDLFASQSMDGVFSSHLLEHYEYKQVPAVLKEWFRVLKVGGYLTLYLPDEDEYPKVGEKGANPDHKWNVNKARVLECMPDGFDLIKYEKRNGGQEYSLLLVFRKLGHKARLESWDRPKPAKTAAVVRYGAFGDLIQASSLFPALKEQGYHVTVYTVPKGHDVVKADPHVDAWIIQDPDQVPNSRLKEFWDHQEKQYDKWINLSGSVEETLLAVPNKVNHAWPQSMRHKHMNVNYLEFTHDIAELPMPARPKFYPTADEKEWARKQRKDIGPSIMYVMTGSSVHKVWPHMDGLLARIFLKFPHMRVITVGQEIETYLEEPWKDESRVIRRAGKWTIRQTMAYALECDIVIGPETGVMNAVSHEAMRKVCFLSHSSHENLTRDWVNTAALEPVDTPCYPCHRMHYDWDHCTRSEDTGVALCASNISVDRAWAAIENTLKMAA
jgi:ADP-heptose:LPS heptosyltransferase/predicted SAM-dependent methyltransferase